MLLLSLLLASALAAEPSIPKLACTSFTCSEDITPGLCEAYERRFTSELTRTREVSVTTQRDVAQIIGLERQKALMGCAEDATSCTSELAGALGVDGMLTGSVTRTPGGYLLSLKVLKVTDGSPWASASERLESEGQLLDVLDPIAARFVGELVGRKKTNVGRVVFFSGAALALGLSAGGAALVAMSKSDAALLKSDQPQTPLELQGTASRGSTFQTAGALMLTAGVPIFITCLVLALVDPGSSRRVALVPSFSSRGAFVSLTWELR